MTWKVVRFEEGTDYDRDKGFIRFKRVVFTVNGTEHTIRVSMKDFNDGRTNSIVGEEAARIEAVLRASGHGPERKK
jgi:hypothetical protein